VHWAAWTATVGSRPLGLQGLTLGIIGLGNIGLAIAERARAFDMSVIAVDLRPMEKPASVSALWSAAELPELLRRSDTALRMGVVSRAELNVPAEAEYYLNLGVKHFCLGADVTTIYNWSKENGTRLRDMLRGA
jgi:3-hydroxyisobutyrate dehydrogenase-like beta-hydroxyacid dehydrogenase